MAKGKSRTVLVSLKFRAGTDEGAIQEVLIEKNLILDERIHEIGVLMVLVPKESVESVLTDLRKLSIVEFAEVPPARKLLR